MIDDCTLCILYFHQVLSIEYGSEVILMEVRIGRDKGDCSGETLRQGTEDGSL